MKTQQVQEYNDYLDGPLDEKRSFSLPVPITVKYENGEWVVHCTQENCFFFGISAKKKEAFREIKAQLINHLEFLSEEKEERLGEYGRTMLTFLKKIIKSK